VAVVSATHRALRDMIGSMVHRGPDAEGVWHDPQGRCSLGHRRLSIIDTSQGGLQPMSDLGGRRVISFNGEIYNFLELRPELEAAGMPFRGRTDTEVLLQSLAR
jgi:asparagine synthetase B (glutamine-hydrolysing)